MVASYQTFFMDFHEGCHCGFSKAKVVIGEGD